MGYLYGLNMNWKNKKLLLCLAQRKIFSDHKIISSENISIKETKFKCLVVFLKMVGKTGNWQRLMVNNGQWWGQQVVSGGWWPGLAVAMVVVDWGCYRGSRVADSKGWSFGW